MGRRTAFGRPKAHERLLLWWSTRSQAFRHNAMLAVTVGVVVVALIVMATSRDSTRGNPATGPAGPQLTVVQPLSTVVAGDLRAAGTPTSTSSTTSTTTTVVAVASTLPAATPATTAAVVPTSPPSSVTTTEVPAETPAPTTTTLVMAPPVVTTPPTTAAPTTIPSSTIIPATSTTALPAVPLPLGLPPLLGPG